MHEYITCLNESCRTYEGVMAQLWMRHVTHAFLACMHSNMYVHGIYMIFDALYMRMARPAYQSVKSHVWMSYVTHMNESCHTHEWVMPHIWTSHVTHMNESRDTYGCYVSCTWMNHVTHLNKSCHTHGRHDTYGYMHELHMYACDMQIIQMCYSQIYNMCMLHIWIMHLHVAHSNNPCHTYDSVMSEFDCDMDYSNV